MDNDLELFAKRLKNLRKKRGLTLEKFAELVEISPNHISKLESAKTNPSFQLLSRIAHALNLEMADLFQFDKLQSKEDIEKKVENLAKYPDISHLQKLLKIHRDLIS